MVLYVGGTPVVFYYVVKRARTHLVSEYCRLLSPFLVIIQFAFGASMVEKRRLNLQSQAHRVRVQGLKCRSNLESVDDHDELEANNAPGASEAANLFVGQWQNDYALVNPAAVAAAIDRANYDLKAMNGATVKFVPRDLYVEAREREMLSVAGADAVSRMQAGDSVRYTLRKAVSRIDLLLDVVCMCTRREGDTETNARVD